MRELLRQSTVRSITETVLELSALRADLLVWRYTSQQYQDERMSLHKNKALQDKG